MTTVKAQLKDAIVKLGYAEDKVLIDYPAQETHGDYSCNIALVLAKEIGKKPIELAGEIVNLLIGELVDKQKLCDKIEAVKPGFINFYLSAEFLNKQLGEILKQGDKYGQSDAGKGKKIIVEYSSPNTNKPLHIGHLRNDFIGMSLGQLYKLQGYEVLLTEIVNDRGVHICKSMLAYQKWGEGDTPEKSDMKSDHFVGKYYAKFGTEEEKDPALLNQAQELLQKWEAGNKETVELWQQMNNWAEAGFVKTYDKIGSHFDYKTYESDIYGGGKEIVNAALENGRAEKHKDDSIVVDMSEYKLGGREDGKKTLIRPDGTSVYITQDLNLAVKRYEEHKPDKILYVVADEQAYHFKVLFKVLELFGYAWAEDVLYHVGYGMVNSPTGKFSSRLGTAPDVDGILAELENMARDEVKKREKDISEKDLDKRAEGIALAALKFHMLKVDAKSGITYDPKSTLDFEGNTGPYLLYAYARLSSILSKVKDAGENSGSYSMSDVERSIVSQLLKYSEILERATNELKPHHVAEYIYNLASRMSTWYSDHQVLKADPEAQAWRLQLVKAVRSVIGSGLSILNIETLERM